MIEDVHLDWFIARIEYGPVADAAHAADLAGGDGTVIPVSLDWKRARCPDPDCDWLGNPVPDEAGANAQLEHHRTEVHSVEE